MRGFSRERGRGDKEEWKGRDRRKKEMRREIM